MDPDLQHCSNLSALSFKPDPNPSFAVLRIRIILIRIRIHDVKNFVTDPNPGRPLIRIRIQAKMIRIQIQEKGLKGQYHEIFYLYFFHKLKPSGLLINRLKWFCLKVCFLGEIRKKFDSAQANTAWSRTLPRLTLRRVELCAG